MALVYSPLDFSTRFVMLSTADFLFNVQLELIWFKIWLEI